MNKKMLHHAWFLLLGLSGFAFGVAQAAGYDVVTDWATVSSAGYQDGQGDLTAAKGWHNDDGVATVKDEVIKVNDEEVAGELVYLPANPQPVKDRQIVEMHFPTVNAGVIPEAMNGSKGAVAAVDGDTEKNWYGWCSAGWTKLTGATPPTEGGCDVRMAFSNDVGKVCYAVKVGDSWVELKPEGAANGWLPNGATPATRVVDVAFMGKTALTDVKLTQVGTVTATSTIAERMTAQEVTAETMNVMAANGNRNWENLVLGLSCKDASSKPVVKPVQTTDASKLTLKLGGVDVDTGAGATVTYTVTASDQIGGTGTTTGPIAYNVNADMDLPSSGAKYYRMTVTTTPAN